jgi:hypothetical protein
MQQALRPYATAGIALVGASIIAVTPVAAPPIGVQMRPVQLVDAWSDLFTETTANVQNIINGADSSAITQVFSTFLTNPLGVIDALTNLTPTVATGTLPLPIQVSVDLPPGLDLAIAQFGAEGATLGAINGVVGQLMTDPSNALTTLYEGLATILNAGLNGQDNVSLLDGIINIPVFNGILAPLQSMSVDLNLTNLVDALGLGGLNLGNFDLTSLLNQIGLGDLTVGSLFSDLGLSGKGLGDLLGDPSLGTLLSDLGLGNLDLGSFSLTTLLTDLGLNSTLGSLTLTQVLDALGLNTDVGSLSLTGLITDLFPNGINVGGVNLGTLLNDLGLISPLATDLNSVLSTLLGPQATALNLVLQLISPTLSISNLVSTTGLTDALNELTLGNGGTLSLTQLLTDLGLGSTSTGDLGSITTLLHDLGITIPSTGSLTISSLITDVLHELNVNIPATGDINLSTLLGDLNIDNLSVGSLLNTVNLGDLLNDLGISNLPLNLSDLGDLTNLTLGGLLGDLGVGDLANISVDQFGGMITQLVDTVPQQILAALGI